MSVVNQITFKPDLSPNYQIIVSENAMHHVRNLLQNYRNAAPLDPELNNLITELERYE